MSESLRTDSGNSQQERLDRLFTCLGSRERRRIVRFVSERAPEPVSRQELATAIAAENAGKSREEVTDEERQPVATRLHHTQLPSLTDAELLTHDAEDDTVALTDHPAFRDSGFLEIMEGDVSTEPASLDTLFRALGDGRRRTVLDVLSHQFGPIHVETLARELEAADGDTAESAVPAEAVDRVVGHLHHAVLPHLSEAGLIEYDTDEQTAAYDGHPQLHVPWMHSVLHPDFRRSLTEETDPNGLGEITGREQVVSFGQSLCDRADDELFCMFTDTDLLEAGCLTRLRDAARERDVDVYLGTRDPTVRRYVENNAPEVVLWEPDTDWLNLPAAGDRVGRLLLADREAVMLGTLREETIDGFHEEQAVIGEGEHNTLVTMICQLLGPHLEEIETDTEDIGASLPL